MVTAFLTPLAIVQAWLIWFALPLPNTHLVMSVGMIWMVSLINGFVIESGALALIAFALGSRHLAVDTAGMSTGLSIAAMIGTATVAASFAYRFQRALRKDDESFPTVAGSSERGFAGLRRGTWMVAAGAFLVFAANVIEIAEGYGHRGADEQVRRIGDIVLALSLVGFGIVYVVSDLLASRKRQR